MSGLKLMTVVGTRPEIIRLSEVTKACDRFFDHILVHTGQNWDYRLNGIFFDELGLRPPDHYLDCARESLGETVGQIIAASYEVMCREKPDALLILGDTNSTLSAISAKRLKIPVFHMEAGNRCFDQNVPEEINRKIVDHIADVNLPYTEHSRRYLRAEGLPDNFIFVTGSPMREVLQASRDKIAQSGILSKLNMTSGGYFVVSAHREENIDAPGRFDSLMTAVNQIAESYALPVIFSVHPRSRKQIEKVGFQLHPLVRQAEPFGFFDYVRLQQDAFCVLSDSGTLSEESAMLGFPAVLLRSSTERPEAVDAGAIVLGGTGFSEISQAVKLAVSTAKEREAPVRIPDYEETRVSLKVVRIIQSYTKIVNEFIWRKGC